MTFSTVPTIIQGGMGVAVSSWQMARAVAAAGQLGVVSGTALDAVLARRLQDGDPGGHCRRALSHFPDLAMVERVLARYLRPDGRAPGVPYRPHPRLTAEPGQDALDLSITGNFVEVWLAKEGHQGIVGINLLEKIQMGTPAALLGAILAEVDVVLMGAGIPREIPGVLTALAAGRPCELTVDVVGATRRHVVALDPGAALGVPVPDLRRPEFLAIVSVHSLATYLCRDDRIRPDGFVVEGPQAGGHSAPPRGRLRLGEDGEPVYGPRDVADLGVFEALGAPFWLAGAQADPEGVAATLATGASGVQCGTVFALSTDSGLTGRLRARLLAEIDSGRLRVRNDPRASPTGFPFKLAELSGTVAQAEVYEQRPRLCDLSYLREPYERLDGSLGYRCASEPVEIYLRKGGVEADTVGRRCLCNALMADIGLGQTRKDGYTELPGVTLGQDLRGVRLLSELYPQGWSAAEAVRWLLSADGGQDSSSPNSPTHHASI
ncbi:NAD(P)H-dependent flavin oxidoreductase YrpB, nitropropane dioxygenase family [Austwickia chelonae]|uniref:Putative 2-nitropropane dioxygenase n=1 Tax=Austwickia chelonae NBRC 105200 TaxID=1184607 RepID=K6VSQ1_9MICO|nr:nitronate monooxygenase [Austwickia chelonae]GAB78370.1 putative 2-nitropropane dioxygenase [Austwickia chelonae NBRC 105200]SEW02200.1 NAD(P)H-dependent flavin oxidoreductase YrpB, nitropropane dioxygenase family [Austwickia chelonae]